MKRSIYLLLHLYHAIFANCNSVQANLFNDESKFFVRYYTAYFIVVRYIKQLRMSNLSGVIYVQLTQPLLKIRSLLNNAYVYARRMSIPVACDV